jgi:4a-hydroxytetrahydrobiopterin dehydratase
MKNITTDSPETDLARRKCKACDDGGGRLNQADIQTLKQKLPGNWSLEGDQKLEKTFEFSDFKEALAFTNRVGEVAEQEGHHPDIYLTYGEVRLELSTHSANGLTENDFILAAKINELNPQ